jgi:uncharacterized protein
MWMLQRSMIYFPIRHLGPPPPSVQEVTFTTSDGLELGGWFFPAKGADGRAVLVCNGNGGNRSHRVPLAEALSEGLYTASVSASNGRESVTAAARLTVH